jgi:hypothetical protein
MLRVARLFAVRTNGPDQSSIPTISGELLATNRYRRALATADLIAEHAEYQLRTRGSLGAGHDLPLAAEPILGGPGGFPGLMLGERRGDRMAFAAIALAHPLVGSLYWRFEGGRGWTWLANDTSATLGTPQAAGWVTGIDAGVAADTPLGPLTISYGVATGRRRVFKLRIGG